MTTKMRNILRGVGSVISVDGASTIRNTGAARKSNIRALDAKRDALTGDFRRIGRDFSSVVERFDEKRITHG